MSAFDDLAASVLAPALQSQFGERAYLTPAGGSEKTVTAIVERGLLEGHAADRGARSSYQLVAKISKKDLPRITVNGDTIRIAKRKGDTTLTRYNLAELLDQDGGLWTVGLS